MQTPSLCADRATREHRRGEQTADRILDAAEALFAERGMGPVLTALGELLESPELDERAFVERIMKLLAEHPNLAHLIQYEVLTGGERLSPVLRGWIQPIFAKGHEAIEASPAPVAGTPSRSRCSCSRSTTLSWAISRSLRCTGI